MEANRLVGKGQRMGLQQMEARQRMGLLQMRKMTSSLSEAVGTEARRRETVTTRRTVCKQHQNQKPDTQEEFIFAEAAFLENLLF